MATRFKFMSVSKFVFMSGFPLSYLHAEIFCNHQVQANLWLNWATKVITLAYRSLRLWYYSNDTVFAFVSMGVIGSNPCLQSSR